MVTHDHWTELICGLPSESTWLCYNLIRNMTHFKAGQPALKWVNGICSVTRIRSISPWIKSGCESSDQICNLTRFIIHAPELLMSSQPSWAASPVSGYGQSEALWEEHSLVEGRAGATHKRLLHPIIRRASGPANTHLARELLYYNNIYIYVFIYVHQMLCIF